MINLTDLTTLEFEAARPEGPHQDLIVRCAGCESSTAFSNHVPASHIRNVMRARGWRLAPKVLCADCERDGLLEFRATQRWANQVHGANLPASSIPGPVPGFVYAGGLHILAPGGGAAPALYVLDWNGAQLVSEHLEDLDRKLFGVWLALETILPKSP
jgi:hypothetical protein